MPRSRANAANRPFGGIWPAYAGASLPTLLLTAGGAPLGEMLTNEFLAQEIVRSAVGTIGLIAAVPITTALAALVNSGTTSQAAPAPRRARRRRVDALEQAWGLPGEGGAVAHPASTRGGERRRAV